MALESTAKETYEYQAEAAIVAAACQNVLKRIGKVEKVSPETGTITGKINTGFFGRGNPHIPGMHHAAVTLRISRRGENIGPHIHITNYLWPGLYCQQIWEDFIMRKTFPNSKLHLSFMDPIRGNA